MTAPSKIGKYEIRRQIGRGAMGVVYEAFDPIIERRVAIKTLRLDIFDPSQTADVRARFKREAQSAGQLAHPHIVTVFDYGDHEGTPYIVMEFLAGKELSQVLNRGARLPLSEVVRLMTQLLGALTYAHERKVVHRDVKPGNIFILDDGSLKVVDFGLAHVEASNLTDTGAMLGTPAYMSPEQFLALPIDERSDIFSAGVILYELLTGEKPFTGSVTSIMQKVLRQEPMDPSVLNPMISTAWDTVIKRAMAKKPEARFQSARQFSETIKQVFEKGALNVSGEVTFPVNQTAAQLGSQALRPSPGTQHAAQERPTLPLAATGPDVAGGKRPSRKSLVVAAIAVVVAVGAATLYQLMQPREEQVKPGPTIMYAQAEKAAIEKSAPPQSAAAPVSADRKAPTGPRVMAARTKLPAEMETERQIAQEQLAALQASNKDLEAKLEQRALELKKATERAQTDKLAKEKAAKLAEDEMKRKVAAETARADKLRADKAEAERIAAEKAQAERIAATKAADERAEAEKAKQSAATQEKESYAAALTQFRLGNYSLCRSAFQEFLVTYPSSNFAPSAHYWIGNAYFAERNYTQAIAAHQKVVSTWPEDARAAESMLNIASAQAAINDQRGALTTLEALVRKYPSSPAAATAKQRIAGGRN
jgi:tol-pal system protein YbgF